MQLYQVSKQAKKYGYRSGLEYKLSLYLKKKKCEYDYEIFTGEFVKALLKINNMVNEMELIAEYTGNIRFLHKLREIPELTLKFIATNQSLYV